ncbi:redoxin domain-containing protein [uncultured Maricaulis sp.]|uniref:redoxin domain-containing protein n=1 Tax=uncultured Maricaulis sp. TaxID=174710 RepID=UPI0030DAA053|tara:strand:- start:53760 stop:54272 length:513 start_codon:yes stop_codon:yes gene_type:complete
MTQAPELMVSQWFNTKAELSLAALRGKVVVIEAFQMLCPGCIMRGIPLAQSIQRTFSPSQVAVIGLHSVFEHHAAMSPVSLEAFLHEFRITFPVAVDAAGPDNFPRTMSAYQLRGTPSLLIIDQQGVLRAHYFGHVSELEVGAVIASLIAPEAIQFAATGAEVSGAGCAV